MKPLNIILAAHLAFFGGWGGWLLLSHNKAQSVWLETSPVDPRDLLSGHFVALRYPIQDLNESTCYPLKSSVGQSLFVRLEDSGQTRQTGDDGVVHVWKAAGCSAAHPGSGSGVWIKGRIVSQNWGGPHPEFGIERFYVNENSPLRTARSGQVIARVKINRHGQARIDRLSYLQ